MTTYSQLPGSDVWHWHPRCHHRVDLNTEAKTRHSKPTTGEFCNECTAKTKRDAFNKKGPR